MNAQNEAGGTDVSEQTESKVETTEQETEGSFQDHLLKMAQAEGHTIGDEPPAEEAETETETKEDTGEDVLGETPETEETPAEGEDVKEPEKDEKTEHKSIAEQIAEAKAKGEKPAWYLSRIAEESEKARTRLKRAEEAEATVAQLRAQLSKAVAPQPTEDNPFIDVNDMAGLDRLERSYEKTIDLAEENPDGVEGYVVGRDKDGKEITRDFSPEELSLMKRKADKAIRKFIPERRTYLQQRAVADAQAIEAHPEFKDPESEFTQVAAVAAQKLFSGQALKDPEILIAIGDYARGYLDRVKRNGKKEPVVKTPEAKKILESRKTTVAPTPTRTRSFPERRGTSSATLEKANKELEEKGTQEAAEKYLNALWSNKGGASRKVESVAD